MATAAQIQAALADAQTNALSWADKATLLRRAIDNALVQGDGSVSLPWISTGSDGTNISQMSLEDAAELVAKFESMEYGGIVGQYVEIRESGGGWTQ